MINNLSSFASEGLFHQIALVSVKSFLTTTIIHENRSCSEIMFHSEHELTVIVVVQCDFIATSAISIETMCRKENS